MKKLSIIIAALLWAVAAVADDPCPCAGGTMPYTKICGSGETPNACDDDDCCDLYGEPEKNSGMKCCGGDEFDPAGGECCDAWSLVPKESVCCEDGMVIDCRCGNPEQLDYTLYELYHDQAWNDGDECSNHAYIKIVVDTVSCVMVDENSNVNNCNVKETDQQYGIFQELWEFDDPDWTTWPPAQIMQRTTFQELRWGCQNSCNFRNLQGGCWLGAEPQIPATLVFVGNRYNKFEIGCD